LTDRFSVNPDSLRAGGAQIGQEAQVLSGALTRLQGRLGSLGDVCGGDQPGRSFAAGYEPKVQLVEQALRDMLERGGRPPDEVAALVFDAVRSGRFFITTSDATESMLRERFDAVLAGDLPPISQWDLHI